MMKWFLCDPCGIPRSAPCNTNSELLLEAGRLGYLSPNDGELRLEDGYTTAKYEMLPQPIKVKP